MIKIKLKYLAYTLLFLFSNYYGFSQCGGDDNSITICSKESYNQGLGNPNGVLNLFSLLGGSPVAGGTWTDLNSSGGLNVTTGLLNTWAINQGGVYNYRYTRNGVPGCIDNIGIITLTLGGFPGVDNLNAVACDNNSSVPLFSFLGSNPNPHFNGSWTGGPPGTISGNFFNATVAGVGTYVLTYTVPAVGTCPSRAANVTLTVHPLPEAGTPTPLIFCETDDFSAFTNVDLFDQLAGEDAGGTWSENSGTTELIGPGDSFINIQNIATTFGPGTYTFTYTVNPTHPICSPSTANVAVTIEPVVDLNGATLNVAPDICFSQIGTTAIIATVTQGINPIPNGTYNITYVLTGANTGTQTLPVTFTGGTGSFTINNAFLLSVGTTTVEITTVLDPSTVLDCTRSISNLIDTFIINENPNITDSQLVIDDICITETAIGNISDINAPTIQLSNGSYTITYTISGPSGTSTGQTATININNGAGSYNISNALTGVAGIYTVTITNIVNNATNCSSVANISDTFEVFPIPDATSISVTIPDVCDGENVVVNISGATTLPNGSYSIEYDLTGAISAPNQTATVNFVGGATSFTIPNGLYVIGTSTLTITNLFNTTTTCETTTFTNPSGSFEIHAIPDANDIEISVIDVCLGQSGTVNIFDINPGLAPELTDGSYTITYDLSGANVATGQSTSATITGGNGSFTIPASQLTNIGNTTISIVIITNVTTGCDAVGVPIITTFDVLPIPIINNVSLTVAQPICQGAGTTATVSGAPIADGNYELTYDLTGANTLSGQTVSVLFTGGSTTFNIPVGQIPNIGSYTISITNIVDNNTPNACTSPVSGVTATFVVSENPNITNTTISATTPICLNANGTVTLTDLTSLLANGNYTVTYNLSGANTATNQTASVTITGGTGSYSIPASLLTNIGTTNVTITLITNQATGCSTVANLNTSFDILPLPDANEIEISVVDVCLGQNGTVSIFDINPGTAPELTNGSYTITYNLSGANTAANQSITTTITGGSGSFTIPASLLTNVGNTTVSITIITNVTTGCDAVGVPIITTFDVLPIPIIDNVSLTVAQPICQGAGATATISGASIANGNYQLTYDLTGSNTLSGQTVSVVFTGGSTTFNIPNTQIPNLGNYTISITNIVDNNTPQACSSPVTGVTANFVVIENPNITNTTIAATTPICLGTNGTVTLTDLTSLLANGNYTVTYSLSGANTASNQTASVTIAGGTGSYTIPSTLLTNTGITNVNISLIANQVTGCSTVANLNTSFDILPLPDLTGANIFVVEPICLGSNANVLFNAPSLANGTYDISFNITGANTGSGSASLNVVGGNASFLIGAAQIANVGLNQVTITSFANAATTCSITVPLITDDFIVNPIPQITSPEITIPNVCIGNDATVTITSTGGLVDGTYAITYSITGFNGPLTQTDNVTITGGVATITIPAAVLTNTGLTSFSISAITNNTTTCSNTFTNVQVNFIVNSLPNVTPSTLSVADTCIDVNANGTISGATNLTDGNYTFTYDLSGANTATAQNGATTITAGNGTFTIPSSLFTTPGVTTFTITSITNVVTGCTTTGLSISDSFTVIPLPNASNANIAVNNICLLNDTATVTITNATSLADGNYTIIYDLTGANSSTANSVVVTFTGGTASFPIPSSLLTAAGNTNITIQDLIINTTFCGTSTLAISPVTFVISDETPPTIITDGNVFCIQDNPTIADLTANISPAGTITWYDSATGGTAYATTDLLINGTTYYASLTIGSGCESSERLEVTVDLTSGCSDLFIPDGFSPNNDGLNDEFYIKNISDLYPNFKLEIYNRYGNMVYVGNVNTPNFNGKSNQSTFIGKEVLPTGVYFYILYFNDSDNTKPVQGRLYLSR